MLVLSNKLSNIISAMTAKINNIIGKKKHNTHYSDFSFHTLSLLLSVSTEYAGCLGLS